MMFTTLTALRSPRRRAALAAALLAAALTGALAGCGGGVDSGGTGAPVASYASGTITGFGSVIVNGVRFDDSAAAVTDADDNARSRDDLRLGMTAEVNGTAIVTDADGRDASTARSIVIASELVGPVSANDLVGRRLVVLGQTVDVADGTVFDTSLAGGQAALAVGDRIEVYGHFDPASGRYAATRIERKAASAGFVLRGIVAALDTSGRSFTIGATRISYAALPASAVPTTLADGRFVRVRLGAVPTTGSVWTATGIVDAMARIADDDDTRIRGRVSAFVSTRQFSVNGTPVDAATASFPDGSAGLALGARAEVEGRSAAGVLVARRVEVESEGNESGRDFDVRGLVTALDRTAQTFTVRNVVVSYAGSVDFRDGGAADLALGREVDARGRLSPDGTRLQATRIDLRR